MCRTSLLAIAVITCIGAPAMKASECRADIPDDAGYKILKVVPNVRWGAAIGGASPVKPGDPYTQANVDVARTSIRDELDRQNVSSIQFLDRLSARYISPCTIVEVTQLCQISLHTDKCVTLRIDVLTVHIPTIDTAALSIDRPRSPTDTDLAGVPKPLLALSPRFGVSSDSALGTVARVQSTTDLGLAVRALKNLSVDEMETAMNHVLLSTEGARSLDSRYYRALTDLSLIHVFNGTVKELTATSSFRASTTPFGSKFVRQNEASLDVAGLFNTSTSVFHSVLGSVGYDHLNSALTDSSTLRGSENGISARLAVDGVSWHSPLRASVWLKQSAVSGDSWYTKFLARAGYQKSFAVRPHRTIGIELLTGYGHTSNLTPIVDRFTGGSAGADFLEETFLTGSNAAVPAGPVMRSFGTGRLDWSNQAQRTFGESFVHINATVNVPIGLSRPLIPQFEPLPGVSVADLIKARVDRDNLLKATLESQGYSEADAQAELRAVGRLVAASDPPTFVRRPAAS
jgi:hypothetical protein